VRRSLWLGENRLGPRVLGPRECMQARAGSGEVDALEWEAAELRRLGCVVLCGSYKSDSQHNAGGRTNDLRMFSTTG
jgi:hypothetical protein